MFATAAAVAQDRTHFFDVEAVGESKTIATWGLDTAWLSEVNVARGVEFMGQAQVDVIRFSFTGEKPLINGNLEVSRQAEFDERMRIVNAYSKPDAALYLNNDSEGIEPWFKNASGGVRADRWAQLMALTVQKCEDAGREVVSVAPFNEPDFSPEQGSISRLREVCTLFRSGEKYLSLFSEIRLCGPSALNNDQAVSWYGPLHDVLDEGSTYQLAGNFDSYASFYQYVESKGDDVANDELNNVMEAMVGAEYGMDAGIWWGTAERARGEFVKASDGMRLGYAEHRSNWTAASVYRSPDGQVQAFVGASERQASSTSYRFVSKAREVYFDGYGPYRSYVIEVPGGSGYWINQPNAEKVVNITWGDDIQPAIKGRYPIVNRHSGKVLEVAGGSSEYGSNLQQNEAIGGTHQLWDANPLEPIVASRQMSGDGH